MTVETLGILIVGHGSKLPYNQQLAEQMSEKISARFPGAVVRAGFMNVNRPTIVDALAEFKGSGVKEIVVFPLFLERGVHVIEDIPGLLGLEHGKCEGVYEGIKIRYAEPLGADELIVQLACKRINQVYPEARAK